MKIKNMKFGDVPVGGRILVGPAKFIKIKDVQIVRFDGVYVIGNAVGLHGMIAGFIYSFGSESLVDYILPEERIVEESRKLSVSSAQLDQADRFGRDKVSL